MNEQFIVKLRCDCDGQEIFYGPFSDKESAENFAEIAPTKYGEIFPLRDNRALAAGAKSPIIIHKVQQGATMNFLRKTLTATFVAIAVVLMIPGLIVAGIALTIDGGRDL